MSKWTTEKYRAYHREYMRNKNNKTPVNKEKRNAYMRKWVERNHDRWLEWHRQYSSTEEYKARKKINDRKYNLKHREMYRKHRRLYKARKRASKVGIVNENKLINEWDGYCGICKEKVEKNYHIDHIIPLSKGGSHSQENLQITHPSCNFRKSNKILETTLCR